MNAERKRIVISTAEYFGKIRAWMPVLISWTILCAMLAATGLALFREPVYTAETSLYILARDVHSREERLDQSDMQVSSQMTSDGMLMLSSEQMAEKVIADLKSRIDLELTAEELLEKVEITKEDSSLLLTIAVTDPDPYAACDMANIYRETASSELEDKVRARGIQTVREAIVPLRPSGRPDIIYITAAAILGLFAAAFVLFIQYVAHDAKREPEDIKEI